MNPQPRHTVILIEDDESHAMLLTRCVRSSALPIDIEHFKRSDDALARMSDSSKVRPMMILVDWNLSGLKGSGPIRRIRSMPLDVDLPVVVVSTSPNLMDFTSAYEAGANSYMVKPMDFGDFRRRIIAMLSYWLNV